MFWKADLTSKDQGKEGIQSLDLLLVLYDQLPVPIQMHPLKSFLLPFMSFTRFSFGWALAFLAPYLHTHTASLSFSRSLVPAATSYMFPFYVWVLSGALWSTSACFPVCLGGGNTWKINKLAWTSLFSSGPYATGFFQAHLWTRPKTAPLRFRVVILLFAFFLPLRIPNSTISWLLKLSLPPSLHIPDQLFLVCKSEVQQRVRPLLGSSVTCVRLLPVVWRRPCVLPPDKAVYSRYPLECHSCWSALCV